LQCDATLLFKDRYQRVRETVYLHLQGKRIFCTEDGDSEHIVRNVCLSTRVNDVTHQTSVTLKGTVNSRILNLVIYVDNIK